MRAVIVSALLLLACASCAPRYTTAALGQYDQFQPFILGGLTGTSRAAHSIEVELARPAHVAIIAVTPPAGGYSERPVTFDVMYPQYETDRVHFPAGRHRLIARRVSLIDPRNCRDEEKPSLSGCRRMLRLLPGLSDGRPPGAPSHYLLLAAEEFVDPFEIAEELFYKALEDEPLNEALLDGDTEIAAALFERILLDRRGTPLWAALYVVTH